MKRLFNKCTSKVKDPSKETILILVYENSKYDYIFGFMEVVIIELSKIYNIIFVGKDEVSNYHKHGTFYKFNLSRLLEMKANDFIRVADNVDKEVDEPNYVTNRKLLLEEIKLSIGEDLDHISKVIFGSDYPMILPLTGYVSKREGGDFHAKHNEFFDYIGSDKDVIKKIDGLCKQVVNDYDKRVSVLAFSTHFKSIFSAVLEIAIESEEFNHAYGFVIDPAFFTPYFKHKNIPFTAYYFADDNRGTRNFKKFPIGELQHLVFDEIKESKKEKADLLSSFMKPKIEKNMEFFFAGTLLQEKGDRVQNWYDFLYNLELEKSSIFAPLKANGILFKNDGGRKIENVATEKFPKLYNELKNHIMYKGHLIPSEYNNKIREYKYGLILRCVSFEDSLNYRPILYTKYDILPLLDHMYDPSFIQIPYDIQRHIIVKNHIDIVERINHFNKFPEEKNKIINELKNHFSINTFKQEQLIEYFK